MTDHDVSINGQLLRLQRETHGWTMTDMAMRSCLSIKQIRQLEEGGTECFYSASVKITAAKKVAALLGLSIEQVLAQTALVLPQAPDTFLQSTVPTLVNAPRSEVQVRAQDNSVKPASPKSTQTSLWVIAVLFVAALLVAAWMRPSEESVVVDAEPPLQTLPTDALEPASSAQGLGPDALNSAPVASQAQVAVVRAASSSASSPAIRAFDAAEAASH